VTTFFKKKWQKLCQFGDNPSDNIIVVDDQLTHRLYLTIHTASLHFQGAQSIQIAGLKEVEVAPKQLIFVGEGGGVHTTC
jgi:hypothetical protein